ncbi:MAG: hypothetical protein ACRDPH_02570 [Marmoricola sp.]
MTDELDRLRRLLHDGTPSAPPDPARAVRARLQARRLRRTRRATYAGVVVAVLLAVGIPTGLRIAPGPGRPPAPAHPGPAAGCPVTHPLPPDRVPRTLRGLGHWYGAGRLWVDLSGLSAATPGRLKFGTFTLDARGRMSDAAGPPSLRATRLDGTDATPGDRLTSSNYASANGPHGRIVRFWPTTITLPGPGCWALTETLHGATVRFVVRVRGGQQACEPGRCDVAAIRRAVRTPLRTPPLGSGGTCPVSGTRRFGGGAGFSGPFTALGDGPVYFAPAAQHHPARVVMRRVSGHPGWLWTKPIWVFDPSYAGPVLLRGKRIGGPGRVEFDRYLGSARTQGEGPLGPYPSVLYPRNGLHDTRARGLESFPGGLYVRRPGCYAVQVDGAGFTGHIVFEATAPSGR